MTNSNPVISIFLFTFANRWVTKYHQLTIMKKIFYIATILTISLCSCSNKQSIQSNNWELKVCHRPDPSSHQENDGRRCITIPQMRLQICKDGFYDTRKNGSRPLVQQEYQYRYRGLQLRNAIARQHLPWHVSQFVHLSHFPSSICPISSYCMWRMEPNKGHRIDDECLIMELVDW